MTQSITTEKTQGKLEVLNVYLTQNYGGDAMLNAIIKNIVGDYEPTMQAPKLHVVPVAPKATIPTSTTLKPKYEWSPERRAKQMANNKLRREGRLSKEIAKPKYTWSPERRKKQLANLAAKKKAEELAKTPTKKIIVVKKKAEPVEQAKVFPEKIDLSKLNETSVFKAPKAKVSKSNTKEFKSKRLQVVTFDPKAKTLKVTERDTGKSYTYHNVPEAVKTKLFNSDKPGTFYNAHIVKVYSTSAKKQPVTK